MKRNSEPEIFVPPDMEHLEIEEPLTILRFPFKRLGVMIVLSLLLVFSAGTGIKVYIQTKEIPEVIPYWIFSVLLVPPTAFSYYFFFSYFYPRLRNPYEHEEDFD